MKTGQRLWTRDELLLALNLYYQLPFGKLDKGNPEVVRLATIIDRTPSSVAYKLVNFASLDPSLQARGIKGATNASKLDRDIWNEFYQHLEDASYESQQLYQSLTDQQAVSGETWALKTGLERETVTKARINQAFFRKSVLASYNYTCCITGITLPELLVAGHIRPWSMDEANRLNPRNGLCLNALHDKAFEGGMITITPDLKVLVSNSIKQMGGHVMQEYFWKYDQKEIIPPTKFLPDPEFLKYHNHERFRQ